jgi:hypothetical protein
MKEQTVITMKDVEVEAVAIEATVIVATAIVSTVVAVVTTAAEVVEETINLVGVVVALVAKTDVTTRDAIIVKESQMEITIGSSMMQTLQTEIHETQGQLG